MFIYRYVTECSFDAYTYQILENKQKFISGFLSGTLDSVQRSETDIDDIVLDYSEIKALAIGNPLIKKRVEKYNELQRLKIARRQKDGQLRALREVVYTFPEKKASIMHRIGRIRYDILLPGQEKERGQG